MTARKPEDEDERNVGTVAAAYALGGPALAGAIGLGALTGEGQRARPHDPAPIGSDPWLVHEVTSALARADIRGVTVSAKDAVVTVSGSQDRMLDIDRAARTVQGIKDIRFER